MTIQTGNEATSRAADVRGPSAPHVCRLDDPRATGRDLVGAKAAALATAAVDGLPVLPGFVITTAATAAVDAAGGDLDALDDEVRARWTDLSDDGARSLVVRSSSTVEDLAESSMAGRFESVVGVEGWDEFVAAVRVVLDSRARAAEGSDDVEPDSPLAVLVQPLLDAATGGVLFGVDPVTGRSDRRVVASVAGGPDALVSGEVDGDRYLLDDDGHTCEHVRGDGGASLGRRQLQALLDLGDRAARTFGSPQDVEWAIDRDGRLWLLQSRDVTTEVSGVPQGPILGTGPVAETFPDPLSRLEAGLWVPALRRSLRVVLELTGAASADELDASPVATLVDGYVVVDLELFGEVPRQQAGGSRLDPRPRIRRLRTAWRVGRLRAALPDLADDLLARTDAELLRIPSFDELSDRQLLALLDRCAEALTSLHGHEILLGLLVDHASPRFTSASLALRVLARARLDGMDDADIAVRHPVVLALVPPRIAPVPALPPTEGPPDWTDEGEGDRAATLREALRLRVRWLQELGGRAAWVLGERLAARDELPEAAAVRHLRIEALRALVTERAVLLDVVPPADEPSGPPPARFRLSTTGRPVPIEEGAGREGSGAGGGRGRGPAFSGDGTPPEGSVLVVQNLDPGIATKVHRLAGLVAETGSVLAHVAILAREAGVPTVVGVAGARERFPDGTVLVVDGTTGEVRADDEGGEAGAGGGTEER